MRSARPKIREIEGGGLTDPHDSGDGPLSHNIARITSLLFPYFHGAKILVGAVLAVTDGKLAVGVQCEA